MFLFAFALYAQSISFNYALDDQASIKQNRLVHQGLKAIPTLMKTDSWYGADIGIRGQVYRPATFILFAMEWEIFPDNPPVYHFINVLLYALTCWILFLLLSVLFKKQDLLFPFVCSLLFAAHPIHSEVVNNIKSVDEILCFLFGLLAGFMFFKFMEYRSIFKLLTGAVCYFIALLSKETAIIFLLAIPLLLFYFTKSRFKQIFNVFSVLFVTAALYFFIRLNVLQSVPEHASSPLFNTLYAAPDLISQKASAFYILLKYLLLLIFPHPLSYTYEFAQISVKQITDPIVIFSILIHLALGAYALIKIRKKNLISFAILFYFLAIAPVSNVFIVIGSTLGERLLYMPSLSFCMIAAFLIIKFSKAGLIKKKSEQVWHFFAVYKNVWVWVFLLVGIYSVKTFIRSKDWRDNVSLFGQDVKTSGKSASAHYHWGNAQLSILYPAETDVSMKNMLLDNAIKEYKKAVEIYPYYIDAYKHLGDAYDKRNDNQDAIKYFEIANDLANNSDTTILHYLGHLYDKTGQFDKAISTYQALLIKEKDAESEIYYYIGLLYNKKKQYDMAITYLDSALKRNPGNVLALKNKALAYINLNKNAETIAVAEKILKIDSNFAKAYSYAGFAYLNMQNYPKAVEYLEKSLQFDPADIECINRLIYIYQLVGDRERVKIYSEKAKQIHNNSKQ
ncbi:MAG: tetratricopeptide repeat protein [Bacteroidota bacterium]|nr:tetratricopeptide repeat protein [Bacteroidota bacterium]